jgi:hypothetical protein
MKVVSYYLVFSVILLSCLACNPKNADQLERLNVNAEQTVNVLKSKEQNSNEEQIIKTLHEFYKNYISASCEIPEDFAKVDSILHKYTTNQLLNQIQDPDIDYDLLINGNNIEEDWLNAMSISVDLEDSSIYNVSFEYQYLDETMQKIIRLQMMQTSDGYKIDRVIE